MQGQQREEKLVIRIYIGFGRLRVSQIDAVMGDYKSFSFSKMMGCCGCFGFVQKPRRRRRDKRGISNLLSQGLLLDGETEGEETYSGDVTSNCTSGDDNEVQAVRNRSEDILNFRAKNGMVCRPFPVKETCKLDRSEVSMGVAFLFFAIKLLSIYSETSILGWLVLIC